VKLTPNASARILEGIEALAVARHQRKLAGARMLAASARFEHLDNQVTTQRKALEALIEAEIQAFASAPVCAVVVPISERRSHEISQGGF